MPSTSWRNSRSSDAFDTAAPPVDGSRGAVFGPAIIPDLPDDPAPSLTIPAGASTAGRVAAGENTGDVGRSLEGRRAPRMADAMFSLWMLVSGRGLFS